MSIQPVDSTLLMRFAEMLRDFEGTSICHTNYSIDAEEFVRVAREHFSRPAERESSGYNIHQFQSALLQGLLDNGYANAGAHAGWLAGIAKPYLPKSDGIEDERPA